MMHESTSQDGPRKAHPRVARQQHGDDVGSARSGMPLDDQARTAAQKHAAEDADQKHVLRKVHVASEHCGRVFPYEVGHAVHDYRNQQGRADRLDAEHPAEHFQSDQQQRNVEHQTERSDLNRGYERVQHDTGAVHASGNDPVRVHEQHEAGRQDHAAQNDAEPRAQRLPGKQLVVEFRYHFHVDSE